MRWSSIDIASCMLSGTQSTAFEAEFVDALKERGHNVTLFDINLVSQPPISTYSGLVSDLDDPPVQGVAEVQAVARHENGTLTGASDSRKNGRAWAF